MNIFKKISSIIALGLVTTLALSGCSPQPDKESMSGNDYDAVVGVFIETIGEIYNHDKDIDYVMESSNVALDLLGPEMNNYDPTAEYLLERFPVVEKVYSGDPVQNDLIVANGFRVMNAVQWNGIQDVITAEVDMEVKGEVSGSTASIPKSAITFSSVDNDVTGLADMLNETIGYKSTSILTDVVLVKVSNVWLLDMSSLEMVTATEGGTSEPEVVADSEVEESSSIGKEEDLEYEQINTIEDVE